MVTSVTNFGRSGVSDWLIQRVSAVILLAYTLFILYFLLCTPDLGYEQWKGLFAETWVRIFSLLAILSLVAHAWIGLWCVTTDYITTRMMGDKANMLRWLVQAVCALVAFVYLVWTIEILWS